MLSCALRFSKKKKINLIWHEMFGVCNGEGVFVELYDRNIE